MRKRRMPWIRLMGACGAVFFVVSGMVFAYHVYAYAWRTSDAEPVSFTIAQGETLTSVAKRLKEEDILASPWWFVQFAKWTQNDRTMLAGETIVTPGDSYSALLKALRYPAQQAEVAITIPEGYTLAQIGEAVQEKIPDISWDAWNEEVNKSATLASDTFIKQAKKPDDVDLEGYLFPDTYQFFLDASAYDVAERLMRTMESRIAALGEPSDARVQSMTLHERITLASIIEREVRAPSDMKQVSDIFLKRLDVGMALQSDATVNYVTGGTDPSLSLTDRDLVSPYNTYQNPGLPPGPISNPGFAALDAVWHPTQNPYYYFLTDVQGTVYYAQTHDEHVENKQRYLK